MPREDQNRGGLGDDVFLSMREITVAWIHPTQRLAFRIHNGIIVQYIEADEPIAVPGGNRHSVDILRAGQTGDGCARDIVQVQHKVGFVHDARHVGQVGAQVQKRLR